MVAVANWTCNPLNVVSREILPTFPLIKVSSYRSLSKIKLMFSP